MIGHSLGGYTGLAMAGGLPLSDPRREDSPLTEVARDPRVVALVLFAPATVWSRGEKALRGVDAPILMLAAEHDPFTPRGHSGIVLDGVVDRYKVQHRVVENTGHFSFLSPFPDRMTSPSFPPSLDPPGFDRRNFHDELNLEVSDFLERFCRS